ncbi:MAG: YbeD family protein [Gammaproteobacteria bacterium]
MAEQHDNGERSGNGDEHAGSPLVFPTDYPIKVVGRSERSLRMRIDAIVLQHAPDLSSDRISERASGAGNFTSITYVIIAQSREQVTALVGALVATEGVLMVI